MVALESRGGVYIFYAPTEYEGQGFTASLIPVGVAKGSESFEEGVVMGFGPRVMMLGIPLMLVMAPINAVGQSVLNLSEDEKFVSSIPLGNLGFEIAADGRRFVAAAPGKSFFDRLHFYHWEGPWAFLGKLPSSVETAFALDEEYLLAGLGQGAVLFGFDDEDGQIFSVNNIGSEVPASVSISFPLAALAFPDKEPFGEIDLFRYDNFLLKWVYLTTVSGTTVKLKAGMVAVGYSQAGTSGSGWVEIYEFSNGQWVFLQTLGGFDPGGEFGASLGLSGEWLAVGAPMEDTTFPQTLATDIGAVHLFKLGLTEFSLAASFFGQRDFDHFGESVDLAGATLAVGSPDENQGPGQLTVLDVGAVYVYRRSGGLWNEAARLHASDPSAGDRLGYSVAVSDHGVLAGAPFAEGPGAELNAGAVYFWEHRIFADGFE